MKTFTRIMAYFSALGAVTGNMMGEPYTFVFYMLGLALIWVLLAISYKEE